MNAGGGGSKTNTINYTPKAQWTPNKRGINPVLRIQGKKKSPTFPNSEKGFMEKVRKKN